MAADKLKGVKLQGGTYYVRIVIPADVRVAFGGKGELWETLGTGNPHDAVKMAPPIRDKFKRMIAEARSAGPLQGPLTVDEPRGRHGAFRQAMGAWGIEFNSKPLETTGSPETPWTLTAEINKLYEAAKTGNFDALPDFDLTFSEMVREGGGGDLLTPTFIATYRRDAAQVRAGALQFAEKRRIAAVLEAQLDAFKTAAVTDMLGPPPEPTPAAKALPEPSLSLRKLFDQWAAAKAINEKEAGRREHQIRRLIEVVGDKPANHLTKADVREFMDLVARFPGRKRSVQMNALPMRKLVEKFEKENAVIAKRNSARVEEAKTKGVDPTGLEEIPSTLRAATVDEWFGAFRQMFEYAVAMHDFEYNPFDATRKFVAKGSEAQKRREFTAEEITQIFSAPLFNGFDGDGSRGYRNTPGTTLIRDAKYWLPILALFHGGRLAEFAAMPHADLKQDGAGVWYFDLTNRQVKNETSQRYIPLHPEVEKLGFLEYVAELRRRNSPWLFPDLDHETKHGPGHSFSKWWGYWMDARGMTDKSITHHSWRHTWKRAARQSDVKEEMHDVISGHKGPAVSRSYGLGADVGPLARDMALISFPSFPNLPVSPARASTAPIL